MKALSNFGNRISERATELYGDISKKAAEISSSTVDPTLSRLKSAGLEAGAKMSAALGTEGGVKFVKNIPGVSGLPGTTPTTGASTKPELEDWRIRVSLPPNAKLLYQDVSNLPLIPLIGTNGVVFPYTPNITVSHKANYQATKLTHSNYASFSYEGSEVDAITIDGEFTVQNQSEGQYLFAAIHFFRSASKMFFGASESVNRGNPPPILVLNGYGSPYFPSIKCVLTNFSHTMPADVDYVSINIGHSKNNAVDKSKSEVVTSQVRLPTTSKISITLQPVYSRRSIHRDFSIDAFASGKLLDKGFI